MDHTYDADRLLLGLTYLRVYCKRQKLLAQPPIPFEPDCGWRSNDISFSVRVVAICQINRPERKVVGVVGP